MKQHISGVRLKYNKSRIKGLRDNQFHYRNLGAE